MTTKEIADIAGLTPETVRQKAKELFPGRFEHGKKTVFTQKEAIQLMGELRKKGFVELPKNLGELPKNLEVQPQGAEGLGLQGIMEIMAKAYSSLTEVVRSQEVRLQKIESRVEERQALLPAPQIKPRTHITQLVRAHAFSAGIEPKEAYKELYREFGYRTNTNPTACAKNRGMPIIDYLDAEGMIETLEAVAMDIWGDENV